MASSSKLCACARYYYVRAHATGKVPPVVTERRRLAADAWGALLQVHALLVPVLDRTLREAAQLPLTWYDVLLELSAADDQGLTMSDLAGRVVLSRTRVSRVVDELVDAGLVRREANPADARSAFAMLTAEGRARFRQAAPIYLAGIEQHFAQALPDSDLRAVVRALGRVREAAPSATRSR